ncbi:MAG: hypothetical protein AAGA23_08815 [Pseudomonadota bacterium]
MDADFENERPGWLQGLFWIIWTLITIGFIALIGCAAIFTTEYGSPFVIIGLLAGLILFGFAMRVSLKPSETTGRPQLLAGGTLMVVAAFVVFGSCAVGLGP